MAYFYFIFEIELHKQEIKCCPNIKLIHCRFTAVYINTFAKMVRRLTRESKARVRKNDTLCHCSVT